MELIPPDGILSVAQAYKKRPDEPMTVPSKPVSPEQQQATSVIKYICAACQSLRKHAAKLQFPGEESDKVRETIHAPAVPAS